ncbi:MAG: ice-binding family protein [Ignavibacteriales bacterium]
MTAPAMVGAAQPTVNLGTTSGFAVLAYSTITNTGTTTINGNYGGDVGLYPGSDFPGQASVSVSGAVHLTDAVASKAQDDLVTAYNDADGRGPVTRINSELGGTTLIPGVYDSANGTFQITGTLTLDAQGDPDGVFIFKTGTTLITAADSSINLINSARFCRTFWKVGSSATLGADSHFVGHIFALTSITANSGATVQGQLLARTGAVTLHSNTITNGLCATTPAPAVLHVVKHVINDSGRTADAANFNVHVKMSGSDVAASPAPGVESPGTTYTLAAGTYVVSEEYYSGYTVSYSGDSDSSGNITLAPGESKTVTITNNDTSRYSGGGGGTVVVNQTPAILHVIKHVINDSGGTAIAGNFNLHVKIAGNEVGSSPAPGVESPGTSYMLAAGTYVVSENIYNGYTASYSGDSDSNGNITLASGDNKTVTVTNNDIPLAVVKPAPAILHVIKHVINDSGRTAVAANFKLHVKTLGYDIAASPAPGVESPGNTYTLPAGTYAISEDAYAGYTLSYSGNGDSSGNITLASGDNKTVTITNNDIPSEYVTTTVTGGQLPNTATPLYEWLLIGAAFILVVALSWTRRKRNE